MGNKDIAVAKPATAETVPAKEEAQTAEQAPAKAADTALPEEAAPGKVTTTEKTNAPKSDLYTVASPIKHDGKDYAAGEAIRLPEATAHRLAGYLKV